eukprot:jgi/Chlat1/372/Chrsp10S01487
MAAAMVAVGLAMEVSCAGGCAATGLQRSQLGAGVSVPRRRIAAGRFAVKASATQSTLPTAVVDRIQPLLNGPALMVARPKNTLEVVDAYIQEGIVDEAYRGEYGLLHPSIYWTRHWPTAVAASAELLARPELVRDMRVCELGAGLGLAGLAAAMAGAKRVVITDKQLMALQYAQQSAATNGLRNSDTQELAWGENEPFNDALEGAFDTVLICGVIYGAVTPISALVKRLLTNDAPSRLLVFDPAETFSGARKRFIDTVTQETGLRVSEEKQLVANMACGPAQAFDFSLEPRVQLLVLEKGAK